MYISQYPIKYYIHFSKKKKNPKSIEGLQETCAQTGGLFMESSKVDVDKIVALLSKSIESSKVNILITQRRHNMGEGGWFHQTFFTKQKFAGPHLLCEKVAL